MPTGTLVKITANKKLMVKISERIYDHIYNRLYNESKKKNFPTEYLAVFTKEDDDGEDVHFAMLTPDKYDKQNTPKFERLLRKVITFSTRNKTYDFMNDDNEQVCGISLELTCIRPIKQQYARDYPSAMPRQFPPKIVETMLPDYARMQQLLKEAKQEGKILDLFQPKELNAEEQDDMCSDEHARRDLRSMAAWLRERSEEEQKKEDALCQRDMAETEEYYAGKENDKEIDKIADKAAARAINSPKELNAEEQAIDEDVEKQVARLLHPPPQNAVRRRRTPALTDLEAEVKKLDDLIAANELAIGAEE